MAGLHVEIVTPERSVFSGAASEVLVPAWEGQLGVLPQHDALLTLLRSGVAQVQGPEGVQRWVIGRGFADIGPDRVTVLTDRADRFDALDRDAAREQLAEAQRQLASLELGDEAKRQAAIRAEWAQAVLDA